VAAVYALGDLPNGATWVALEKLAGEALAQFLSARSPLPTGEAIDLAIQLSRGLEASHRVGLFHGNLSPATIVVTRAPYGTPRVKIVGFNVASAEQGGTAPHPAAASYASPHRLGEGPPGPQDDVFSIGAVLYHLLTGKPPARGGARGRLPKVASAVLEKALAREPAARFRTMAELRAALEALAEVNATPVDTVKYRRMLGRAIAAGLVLVVGGALVASVWRRVDIGGSPAFVLAPTSEPRAASPDDPKAASKPTEAGRERPQRSSRGGAEPAPRRSTEAGRVPARDPAPSRAAPARVPPVQPETGSQPAENGDAGPEPQGYVGKSGSAGVSPNAAEPRRAPPNAAEPRRAPPPPPRSRRELDEYTGLRLAIGDVTRVGLAEDVVERRMGLLVVQLTPEGMSVPSATYNLQRLFLAYSAASDHGDSVSVELRRNGEVFGWFTRWGLRYAKPGEPHDPAPRVP
jgi:hypothetical protein